MKTCRKCGLPDGEVQFRQGKTACKTCEAEARRALHDVRRSANPRPSPIAVQPHARPTAPIPLPDHEVAENAHAARVARRDLNREHSALAEENLRLRAELGHAKAIRSPIEILVYREAPDVRADAIACAVASDWHVEEPVDAASVHGLNAYNLEVAKARAEKFFQNSLRLAQIMARESTVRQMWIGFLGDFFSGFIHDELIANNLLAPADAARFCQSLLASGVDFLLRESDFEIIGDMIPGNHGRLTHKMWHGDPTGTSLESVMYAWIAGRYEGNPRVKLDVSEHAMVYRKFFERFNMRLIHGYEVKFGGGVGGLTIPLRKALAQWNNPIRADLTVLGHFHQFFDGGDFIVNGSLIGYNTFAQAIKASYEEPRQAFFLVHARNGGEKALTAPVWLDEDRRKAARAPSMPSPEPKPTAPA